MDALTRIRAVLASPQGSRVFDQVEDEEHRIVLTLKDSGRGRFVMEEVFPGVLLSHHRVATDGYEVSTLGAGEGVKINWCLAGRLEAGMHDDRFLYIAPGELSVEAATAYRFGFPCGFYEGIELFVPDDVIASPPRAFDEMGIDLAGAVRAFSPATRRSWVRRADEEVAALFGRLADDGAPLALKRLKVMELLLTLAAKGAPLREAETTIFTRRQVELAKAAHDALCADLSHRESIESLARRLGTSPTSLKTYFAGVYGQSMSAYLAERRIERAKQALTDGASVAEAAALVGYANPTKFSAAFKRATRLTPSAWKQSTQRP